MYASSRMSQQRSPGGGTVAVELTCPACGKTTSTNRFGRPVACAGCGAKIGKIAQLDQLLAEWFEPRRWRADLVRPSVPYLLERLWTASGQGERLYAGVSPHYSNYDVFRHLVTRLIMEGVEEGWAEITFPPDPFAEDPQYQLRIVDSDRFARGVERLFPEVNWDEPVDLSLVAPPAEQPARSARPAPRAKKPKRR